VSISVFQIVSRTYYKANVNYDNIYLDFLAEGTYKYCLMHAAL